MEEDCGVLLGDMCLMAKIPPEKGPEPLHFLREVREGKGLTQQQVADLVNETFPDGSLTGNDVSRFERSARPWLYIDEATGALRKNTVRQFTPLYQAKFAAALDIHTWQFQRDPSKRSIDAVLDRFDNPTDEQLELAERLVLQIFRQ